MGGWRGADGSRGIGPSILKLDLEQYAEHVSVNAAPQSYLPSVTLSTLNAVATSTSSHVALSTVDFLLPVALARKSTQQVTQRTSEFSMLNSGAAAPELGNLLVYSGLAITVGVLGLLFGCTALVCVLRYRAFAVKVMEMTRITSTNVE